MPGPILGTEATAVTKTEKINKSLLFWNLYLSAVRHTINKIKKQIIRHIVY